MEFNEKLKYVRGVLLISQQELADLAKEEQGTSMTCQHCGKTYTFTKEDLQTILAKVSQ